MKIKYLLVALSALLLTCCKKESSNEDNGGDLPLITELNVDKAYKITEGIGNWDCAYLAPSGFYCLVDDVTKLAGGSRAVAQDEQKAALNWTSPDGSQYTATLISDNTSGLPYQLSTKDEILNFCFLNDSVLEVVCENVAENKILLGDSIAYRLNTLMESVTKDKDNELQRPLYLLATLLQGSKVNKNNISTILERMCNVFGVQVADADSNIDAIANLGLTVQNGNYDFANNAQQDVTLYVQKTYYAITPWTGSCKFKVGGSSCTLDGAIICTSPDYNKYGTYGILIDTNPANLTLDKAQKKVEGRQLNGASSFEVDLRGLKPRTTYYFCTYYTFNDSDHGMLNFKYGDQNAQTAYSNYVSFQTGDNRFVVDVAMCIDFTGSMSGIINTVKSNATSFYDQFKERCNLKEVELSALNIQVFGYQDKNVDGDNWLRVSPTYSMPDEREAFNSFVGAIYADGGGDTPESGLEALELAFKKEDWGHDDGYHRQVVILWTDAPYLINTAYSTYTDLTTDDIKVLWDNMPSGRRLILFAPKGDYGYSNGGSWDVMDSWKNVIHESYNSSSFSDFTYILDSIIEELTGEGAKLVAPRRNNFNGKYVEIIPAANN